MNSSKPKRFEFFAKDKEGWMDIFELVDDTMIHIRSTSDESYKNWKKEVTKTPVSDDDWSRFWQQVRPLRLERWRANYDIAEFDEIDADGNVTSLFNAHGFKWKLLIETETRTFSSLGNLAYPSHYDADITDVDSDGRFGDLCEAIEEMLQYRFCHVDRLDRDYYEEFDKKGKS